jgi:hypothetical protein
MPDEILNDEAAPVESAAQSHDREIWRGVPGDFYSPRIFVTGQIGMNVGGHVIVRPVEEWHSAAFSQVAATPPRGRVGFLLGVLQGLRYRLRENLPVVESIETSLAIAMQIPDGLDFEGSNKK